MQLFPEKVSEKLPSKSVITPLVVPFTTTLAPITVEPSVASVTTPEIVRCCFTDLAEALLKIISFPFTLYTIPLPSNTSESTSSISPLRL